MLKSLVSAILIFSMAGVCLAATPYESHMQKGKAGIEAEDYAAAAKEFRAALGLKPGDFEALLHLGMSLSLSGDENAGTYLNKALMLEPSDPRVSFYLGVFYRSRDVPEETRDFFENTVELAPESKLALKAKKYLKKIRPKGPKRWALSLSGGVQHDSNVILGPEGYALPQGISSKSDWRGVVSLSGQYALPLSDKTAANAGYSFYSGSYSELSDYDITMHKAYLNLFYALANAVTMRGGYSYEYTYVGGVDYRDVLALSQAVTINEGGGLLTTVLYEYSRKNNMDSTEFANNSERTGHNNLFAVSQSLPLFGPLSAELAYSHDKESADMDYWSYKGYKGRLALDVSLPLKIVSTLRTEYYKKDYDEVYPGQGMPRRDSVGTYAVSFKKNFGARYSLNAGFTYTRNKSNLTAFDYKQNVSSLMFSAAF